MFVKWGKGQDVHGLVHANSRAKQTYVWPLCGKEYLDVVNVSLDTPVTCFWCVDGMRVFAERYFQPQDA